MTIFPEILSPFLCRFCSLFFFFSPVATQHRRLFSFFYRCFFCTQGPLAPSYDLIALRVASFTCIKRLNGNVTLTYFFWSSQWIFRNTHQVSPSISWKQLWFSWARHHNLNEWRLWPNVIIIQHWTVTIWLPHYLGWVIILDFFCCISDWFFIQLI